MIYPYLPTLLADFFASAAAGHDVSCAHTPKTGPSPVCADASATVVQWTSVTSLVSNACFMFFLSPLTGTWSDCTGRKPFLFVGQSLSLLPYTVLLLNRLTGFSLYFYFPAQCFNGVVSPLVTTLAYVADVLPPHCRAIGFGTIYGAFAAIFAVMPAIGARLGLHKALLLGVTLKLLGLLYTVVRPGTFCA